MKIRIIQGGQTGVDRGAWRGAVDAGLLRGGWMPNNERDERGPIPDDVRADLRRASGGLRGRTELNVHESEGVIIVVPDVHRGVPSSARGTWLTWRLARKAPRVCFIVDHRDSVIRPALEWLRNKRSVQGSIDLMLAGPRASLWPEGEETARKVVQRIAATIQTETAERGQ